MDGAKLTKADLYDFLDKFSPLSNMQYATLTYSGPLPPPKDLPFPVYLGGKVIHWPNDPDLMGDGGGI